MISVLLATYNGSSTICRFLDALANCKAPNAEDLEVIVVDNASTDGTAKAAYRFAGRLPLRVLHHPVRGKNRALNCGLEQVRGDVVVLTDDDVLPASDWLVAIRDRITRHPEVCLFGGPILPHWDRAPPPWLESVVPMGVAFAITGEELEDGPVNPRRIWGPNMFVRRKVFDTGLRFNEQVGPGPGQYIMGSETDFTSRAAAAGHLSWWCPEIRVHHIIRAGQIERSWLLKRAYRYGKAVFVASKPSGHAAPEAYSFRGIPLFMLREAVESFARGLVYGLIRNEPAAFCSLWKFYQLCGSIAQARAHHGVVS